MKMKKISQSFLKFLLVACIVICSVSAITLAANAEDGQTVILYTANLRGNIDLLPQIAKLKADYEAEGSNVILADAGNYLQGTVYSSYDSGKTVVSLMEACGYDVVTVGSHEFDFGSGKIGVEDHGAVQQDGTLGKFLDDAAFAAVSANIMTNGTAVFAANKIITSPDDLKIGFFGLSDPNTVNQVLESNLANLNFADPASAASLQKTALADCDLTVCLSNVGNMSVNAADVVIDISADAGFKLGKIVIGSDGDVISKESVSLSGVENDTAVKALTDSYKATVDAAYPPSTAVAKSSVTLNGSTKAVRSGETNLGNLWTDALLWFANEGGISDYYGEDDIDAGNTGISVDKDHVVAVWNGGNLRDYINTGDVTKKDINRVLPYPNTVAVVYLTGAQLLEMLEAATQGLPFSSETNSICASFAQVSGIKYTVAANKKFDAKEIYKTGPWYKAGSVKRVSITEINGKPFNQTDVYAIITSNMIYNGLDSNYVCLDKDADLSANTSMPVRDAVWMYINQKLDGVIGTEYAQTQGRIKVLLSEQSDDGDGGQGNNLTTTETGTVKGRLLDKYGKPIAGATLVLRSSPITTVTDSDGYFEFKNVPAGSHRLYMVGDDGNEIDSGFVINVAKSSTTNIMVTFDGVVLTAVLAEDYIPKTGENTPALLYLTVILALAILAITGFRQKNKVRFYAVL